MESVLTYRGRAIQLADVAFIRALIAARPKASRRSLSIELCRAWGWVQSNGALRDAVCRGLLLALHRGGHIELPAPKYDSLAAWRRREPVPITIDATPIERSLAELGPVALRQVRRTDEEALVNALIAQHHYLRLIVLNGNGISTRGRPFRWRRILRKADFWRWHRGHGMRYD